MKRYEKSKIILSCLSGNVLEWFDFAVYGYLAPVIATQFFPSNNTLASILLTYSVFAIGFLVRPIGAVFFGHIGDTWGRKSALVISSLVMAIPTFIIGILPNYESIGMLAPLLLITCRIFQGLSIGGEFTGSFVYLVEQASPGKRGFFSCWADIGCNLGMILGSLCVALLHTVLTPEELASYGWRLPFLSGILLSIIAVFIRSHLSESFEFEKAEKIRSTPLKVLFANFPKALILGVFLVSINALGYYLLVVFLPNQTVLLGKLPANQAYLINTIVLVTIMIATFLSAFACDYIDKVKIYITGGVGCMLFAYPIFYALNHLNLTSQIILMCLMAISLAMCFGPRPVFMVETFPPALRYSAIAIALNVANAILGGTAPLLATYLVEETGAIEIPAILIIIAAGATLFSVLTLRKMQNQQKLEYKDTFAAVNL